MQLSEEKTSTTHVDEGFDFLGHHIRRMPWKGNRVAWTFPSSKSLAALKRKIKSLTRRQNLHLTLEQLLRLINRVLRGWAMYFRFDAAKRTFGYLDHYVWWRLHRWCRKKHPRRRPTVATSALTEEETGDFAMAISSSSEPPRFGSERYRYRGRKDPSTVDGSERARSRQSVRFQRCRRRGLPRPTPAGLDSSSSSVARGEPDAWERARPVRRAAGGNGVGASQPPRLRSTRHPPRLRPRCSTTRPLHAVP